MYDPLGRVLGILESHNGSRKSLRMSVWVRETRQLALSNLQSKPLPHSSSSLRHCSFLQALCLACGLALSGADVWFHGGGGLVVAPFQSRPACGENDRHWKARSEKLGQGAARDNG